MIAPQSNNDIHRVCCICASIEIESYRVDGGAAPFPGDSITGCETASGLAAAANGLAGSISRKREFNKCYASTTRRNIFFKYPAAAVENIWLDTTSIMRDSFPKEFTEGGFETAWNTRLSDQDKEMIRIMYPPG